MIALEEVDEEIRTQAERFYYEWLEPKLNHRNPERTTESRRIQQVRWINANREKINEKQRNKYHQLKTKEKV